ncbi:uncharacterized protein LOC115254176 isoform X1 [Aedes albopictus]|uniref:ribonuclease H n=1 Tax=Aedes albopictus TaxID=7160 RepID=A0ABM1ZQ27_AEDAL
MFSTYEIWSALCKKLVSHWSEYCCNLCKRPRAIYYHHNLDGGTTVGGSTIALRQLQREDSARKEQLNVLREIIAAREIAHHCRTNSYIYTQLQELGKNYSFKVDLDRLSLVQRMFLENRYIFEAIAKHIRVQDLLTEVQICPTIDLLTVSKDSIDPDVCRHLVEYLLCNEYFDRPRIFTDASKSADGRCGIGVYDETNEIRLMMQLKLDTSIMTAETLAIKVAMQHIHDRGIKKAVLLTDSQPACTFLKKSRNARLRNAVANEILEKAKHNRTTIQWIPGHVRIEGNEIADELARQALSAEFVLENDIFVNDAISYFEERQASSINKWYQEYVRLKGKSLKQLLNGSEEEDPYWFMEQNYTQ